ncbi:MAG: DUF523 domain-containing protein [bacterium]
MKTLVSACLLGTPCRMDGRAKPSAAVLSLLAEGEAVPVCPEVLGGLPTPRSPAELQPDGRVVNAAGEDVTAAFRLGAARALEICRAAGCERAILKSKSPSCGVGTLYDGTFTRTLTAGNGVFAALLLEEGLPVLTEEEL